MNKKEARAILSCQSTILKALVTCETKLKGDAKLFMVNYWGAHIRSSLDGMTYGSAPIERAQERLNA